jgi:hypothetical protein
VELCARHTFLVRYVDGPSAAPVCSLPHGEFSTTCQHAYTALLQRKQFPSSSLLPRTGKFTCKSCVRSLSSISLLSNQVALPSTTTLAKMALQDLMCAVPVTLSPIRTTDNFISHHSCLRYIVTLYTHYFEMTVDLMIDLII